MKAQDEIERLQQKLNNGSLPPDEPLFVLRAQDMYADEFVLAWADRCERAGTPAKKIEEARLLAAQMDLWSPRRIPGQPGSIADL